MFDKTKQAADEAEFAAAFNEDQAQGAAEMPPQEGSLPEKPSASEETPTEAVGDAPGSEESAKSSETPDATENGQGAAADMPGSVDLMEGGDAMAAEGADAAAMDPAKEMQRLRSWEGRLRKMQADLEARGVTVGEEGEGGNEQVADAIEEAAPQSDDPGTVEQVAEAVESGEMSPEEAMRTLAEDFGEDFVKMIRAIAANEAKTAGSAAATEKVADLGKAVDDIIAHLGDSAAKAHFKAIKAAHPDFHEVGQSEGFKAFVEAMPEEQRAEAQRVIQGGEADEINELLTSYKATLSKASPTEQREASEQAADPLVDQALDAAEGVRSTGMALPEAPRSAGSNDYASAWSEF